MNSFKQKGFRCTVAEGSFYLKVQLLPRVVFVIEIRVISFLVLPPCADTLVIQLLKAAIVTHKFYATVHFLVCIQEHLLLLI